MGFPVVGSVLRGLFGTRNERMVKKYLKIVDQVSSHEDEARRLSDAGLRAKTEVFKKRIREGEKPVDMIPEVFAVAREAMDRAVGIRNVFNPAHAFDASRLPADVRKLYDETKAVMDATPARDPVDDLRGHSGEVPSWMFVDIPTPIYEAVRELYPESKPPFRARPFDVQIIGAVVLYDGQIAEMKTGEGKTIVGPLACYLAALKEEQVHVVTVNDYLVQRDRDWTFPFFRALGMTVGCIHPYHMQPPHEKQFAYSCDVVYGTTAEFGFDYLRDNMKLSVRDQVQRKRDFAIVDEVDSILIDEARTPLIISGPAHSSEPRYDLADRLARHLMQKQKEWDEADQKVQSCKVELSGLEGDIRNARDKDKIAGMQERLKAARAKLPTLEASRDRFTQFYEIELDKKKATLTPQGIVEAQKSAGIGSFYVGDNIDVPHLLEQAIRAHTVYQRDRDYVVAPDEEGVPGVIIVDQNTGRKMVGRQWSDGLHQAVEAKEGVPIKQETQTMATITIQNFFKLYKRLAGMTGTADTEATEFYEIYKLDVVVIPTNVLVTRRDRNDVVYISQKDKWHAIVDEIKAMHDVGRPVLVGTTSVEKSEMLSEMLKQRHNIQHEVLNAKQHDREAEIIAHAGELGAVMIATNMAGRGTDIKLGPVSREQLINHWKRRGICPREVTPDMQDEAIIAAVFRQVALKELELRRDQVDPMSDEDVRLALLRKWVTKYCWWSEKKAAGADEASMLDALDDAGSSMMHRLRMFEGVADLGGLHVIGTERHESRRIDNQLRGRSGRQGDNGSSRFFLSLDDDLMKMFAGKATLGLLSRLGMKEGDAIEAPMLTRAVEKAQRKVEERNFLIRKNILEYDEVMNVQRGDFYKMRQAVLEGRNVKELIFDHIDDSARDAAYSYLDKNYTANCIAEWVREKLDTTIEPDRIRGKDREDLHKLIINDSKEHSSNSIRVTLGEYMSTDLSPDEWDVKGLADWAKATFKVQLNPAKLKDASTSDVQRTLEDAAEDLIDATDLAPLDQYLVPNYGLIELAKWATNKFGVEVKVEDLGDVSNPEQAAEALMKRAREIYRLRELSYPVDHAMDMTAVRFPQEPREALEQLCGWVRAKFEMDWSPDTLPSDNPAELRRLMLEEAEKWDESRIEERAERVISQHRTVDELELWAATSTNLPLTDEEKTRAADDPKTVVEEKIAAMLRMELTFFERWVLLQILDQSWKDHLHSMDQLKESVGLRSFSQRDPRIEYKREGARLYDEMNETVRDKVTDLVFKAKLTPQAPPRTAPQQQPQQPAQQTPGRPAARPAQPAIAAAAAAATASGTAAQQRDIEIAERAGSGGNAATAAPKRQPHRAMQTVGRNEPCPCGSGKKYKQCHGKK